MPGTFDCPACGAPLHVEAATSAIVTCRYCGKVVIVPEELRGEEDLPGIRSAGKEPDSDGLIGNAQEFGEIAGLVLSGDKIKAIRRYRQLTGLSLRESKEAIEQLERGEPLSITSVTKSPGEGWEEPHWGEVMLQARALLLQGNKIRAIKIYHQAFNAGLKESKDVIDALEASLQKTGDLGGGQETAETRRQSSKIVYSWVAVLIAGLILLIVLSAAFGWVSALAPFAAVLGISQSQETLGVSTAAPLSAQLSEPTPAESRLAKLPEPSPTLPLMAQLPVSTSAPGFARETLSFGAQGTGPGFFTDARLIAVDRNTGNIYVAEYQGGRVHAFDSNGKFLTQWTAGGQDAIINGLAAGRDGVVYVSAGGKGYTYEGATGALLQEISHGEGFIYLESLALTGSDELVAVEGGEDLLWFDKKLQVVRSLPAAISSVSGDSELDASVAVDGIGNLFVLGFFNGSVFHFNSEGKFVNRFGSDGDDPGQFRAPSAIAVDNHSRVYVSDFKGIQVFAPDGRYLDLIPVHGMAFGLAFNDQDELFVISNTQQVIRFEILP